MNLQTLAPEFLTRYVAECLRPSTYRGYRTNLREKGLSNKSIVYVHATLRKMPAASSYCYERRKEVKKSEFCFRFCVFFSWNGNCYDYGLRFFCGEFVGAKSVLLS